MKHQSITSLPPSPEVERHSRMLKYSLAMGIRVLCIVAALFVRGWWLVIPALGAVFLPYFAVVIANVKSRGDTSVLRPGTLVRVTDPTSGEQWAEANEPSADERPAPPDATPSTPSDRAADKPETGPAPESWCA